MKNKVLYTINKSELDKLIGILQRDGYRVVGPTVRDGAITYEEIESVRQLPIGWTDSQSPGRYRLNRRNDDHLFGYVVGPHSLKKFFFPPKQRLFGIKRDGESGYIFEARQPDPPRYAFLGVRACDLAAVGVQDRVFKQTMAEPYYAKARDDALFIAVNCTEPGGTCFCGSMGTGPRCSEGFDLALTELRTTFTVEVGTTKGRQLIEALEHETTDANTSHLVDLLMDNAAEHMGRTLDTEDLPDILLKNLSHDHWNEVAKRCMSCSNCTFACPTCFCSNVEDSTDLSGNHAERWRTWGSCFTLEFSYHTGGYSRSTPAARYRQWLTHNLANWHEQFGTSGCVGCGRCITWCPVGIDITKEATTIANDVKRSRANQEAKRLEEVGS